MASSIRYRPNPEKALEVILWLAQKRATIDFHSILKLLFFADKYHLNRYGRPIVGDQYFALPYGPVAQTTYDILKVEALALETLGLEQLPFERKGPYTIASLRAPDLRKLSRSDVEALEHSWSRFGHFGFGQRSDISHDDPAYARAIERGSQRMHYEDFLEDSADLGARIQDLAETAPRARI